MKYLYLVLLFCSFGLFGQSQGVTNAQTKLRPNQLRWSPTDATLDSVYIIRADTSTGEPGWYLVTLGGGGNADTTLAGDVVGGLNSTFVRKINGVTVENKTPQGREVLQYDGTQWTPDSIDLADLPTLAQSVLLGRGSASTGSPQSISLGTGLSMSGTTLSNSAPDQTVTISGATGTYPNFTVTPTSPGGSSGQVQYNNAGSFGALDSIVMTSNPDRLGLGVLTPTARIDIQGSGSTSATNAFRVRNSSGTNLFAVRNDGYASMQSVTPILDLTSNTVNGTALIRLQEDASYGGYLKLTGSTNRMSIGYNVGGTDYDALSFLENVSPTVVVNNTLNVGSSSPTIINNSTMTLNSSSAIAHGSGVGLNFSPFGFTNAMTIRQNNGYLGQNITNPLAGLHNNFATVASTPSILLSGTGFSGGTSTTTKPTLLIEPTGTTSTGWSTSGTKLGVNAESGFTGNLIDLQVNGVRIARVTNTKLSLGSLGVNGHFEMIRGSAGDINLSMVSETNGTYINFGANNLPSSRMLSSNNGKFYIDGLSEGATKAQNYDIVIGSRVQSAQTSLTGNTTSENGSNIQIGFDATSNPRALLSLNSTTRGFLPTRMTTTQRDAVTWVAGDEGMIIFNSTTKKHQGWDGTTWNDLY